MGLRRLTVKREGKRKGINVAKRKITVRPFQSELFNMRVITK